MAVELASVASAQLPIHEESGEDRESLVPALPPPDRGPAAWKFLFGIFTIEAVLWGMGALFTNGTDSLTVSGFPLSYGVFQDYYSKQPEFEGDSNLAVIGTVSTSIYFLGAPIATPLVKRFQRWQRHMITAGWAGCVASLVAASFMKSVSGLIVTQGVLYGTSFILLYFPLLIMLNEWFVQRRGVAYGVMSAGSGASGVGYPFLLEVLLSKYGYQTTLRAVAVAAFVLGGPILFMLKPRLPPSHHGALRILDFGFAKKPLFWVFAVSNLIQGFGYYIPALYLPTFASLIGISGTLGALILSAENLAIVISQLIFGFILDRTNNMLLLIFISSFVSAVVSFALWGFAHSFVTLLMFALLFGLFAGAFPVLWAKFGSVISEDPAQIYSLMAFGKGIGNLATGPVTAKLLTQPVSSGYGIGKFEPVIIFLGSFMFCSSLAIFGWPLQRRTG
ncbi:MFS domain-containing protein [Fusarium keratoplasticum]|uniref:MFS domain-containing protein n=1 Tax=Fusarium keratoplasticum TaxID=1328300 RepID=A0ACC0QZV6_9HYPO|nr:MFS domain-containing protein [Fusarium keratoplasticum]KAI8670524.1 MFS domain-containing protein [Fusarium keratoplasticum]KAI8677757.1 MFS domain-containing protein [Fusarium keratoplasticum]